MRVLDKVVGITKKEARGTAQARDDAVEWTVDGRKKESASAPVTSVP